MNRLWHGTWTAKLRIASGLVLFAYVLFHLINVGLGLFSLDLMERFQDARQLITRSGPGGLLLYAALLTHAGLALYRLARRRTLQMPLHEGLQILLGLTIPFLLMTHFVHTRVAHQLFDLNDRMGYITGLIWDTPSGGKQALLVLVTWVHACIGLHMWLRITDWWRRLVPLWIGLATLIPAFALAGFMVQGRQQRARFFDAETFAELATLYNWPTPEAFARLLDITQKGDLALWAIIGLTAAIFGIRKFATARRSVKVSYIDGPEIRGERGMTLLELSRANGIPHMAQCGGRGRCTTCRVVVEQGADLLHPPSPQEQASLAAVSAPPNARLACQIRPTTPATVLRVFRPDSNRQRAHDALGEEKVLALLFLDMRGFTSRTAGQLPYDVVFLLNRFFDAIVPAITGAGGTIDKYLGDGLLAIFEQDSPEDSARAALSAAQGIGAALEAFNKVLATEGADPLKIGIGLHLGDLVLGEIGAADNAPRTIIGDTVNTASRLEGQTKELGVELLVSADLLRAANIALDGLTLTALTLRGVSHPVDALPVGQASTLPDVVDLGQTR